MKKTKGFLSMVLALAMMVTCFSFTSAFAEKADQVVITATIKQSRYYDGLQAMIQKLKDEENIVIDCQVVPDAQSDNLIMMRFNSGESTDLIDYNIPQIFPQIDVETYLADLSDQPWVASLVTADYVTYNGKVYGFPFQSMQGLYGFVYNKDCFEKAGITSEPTTWAELLEACEKLKAAGITPIAVPKDTWVPQIMVSLNLEASLGVAETAEFAAKVEKNQIKWTDVPEFAKVIDTYIALFTSGYTNSDSLTATYDDTIQMVGTGEAAMQYNGDFFANSVREAFPEANLGMFNVYMPDAKTDYIQGNTAPIGFLVSKDTDKMETIQKVFELFSTPEYLNLYFENRPGFPAFVGVDPGPTPDYIKALEENYVNAGKFAKEFNLNFTRGKSALGQYFAVYVVSAPVNGDMNGEQMLAQFQTDFENFMKESKQEGF